MRVQLPIQLPLAVLLASSTFACVTDAGGADDAEVIATALELDNGGLDMSDEAPMFGLAAEFDDANIETDSAVTDELETDAALATMERDARADVRDVLVLWGQLPPDRENDAARDWSGELRLSRGGMYVRRRLGFEEATDRLHPRTERDAVRFDSRTRPFADGLALRLVDDPDRSSVDPLRLRYAAASGETRELDLRNVDERPFVDDVGDGNRIVVISTRRNDACAHGFIRGRWHKIAPHAAAYRGVVANPRGEVVGHIRGIAGHRRNGEPVMFGKFINRAGQFSGILKGTYEGGEFQARWLDRDGDHGVIKGLYFEGPTARGGGLIARWAETSCDAN